MSIILQILIYKYTALEFLNFPRKCIPRMWYPVPLNLNLSLSLSMEPQRKSVQITGVLSSELLYTCSYCSIIISIIVTIVIIILSLI